MKKYDPELAYAALALAGECLEKKQLIEDRTLEELSLEQLHAVSDSLGIAAMTAHALNKRGVKDDSFKLTLAQSQRRDTLLEAEYYDISDKLKAAGIRHLPLKGIVLKDLYPAVGLREMSDIDIWFDASRAGDVKSIMTESGYSVKHFDKSKHDVYTKPPIYCVEMHRQPIDVKAVPESLDYYEKQWARLIRECGDDVYQLKQSREDIYIYVVTHAYKHYVISGIGVRVLIDIYVMLCDWGDNLDFSYIEEECGKLGISDFESLVRRLSRNLFDRDNLSQDEKDRLDEFVRSSVHGNIKTYYVRAIGKSKSRASYVLSRFKTSESQLQNHPVLQRHKILRPFAFPVRLTDALIKRRKMLKTELKTIIKPNKND